MRKTRFQSHLAATCHEWPDLAKVARLFDKERPRWIFRGHRQASYPLAPTLERSLDRMGIPYAEASTWEYRLHREFGRQAARFGKPVTGAFETLALMQHYGAPTRLLDWTYSFWVAVWFALENAGHEETTCVWAIDLDWFLDKNLAGLSDELRRAPSLKDRLPEALAGGSGVLVENPHQLNERLVAQQGVFVLPRTLEKSFEENLQTSLGRAPSPSRTRRFLKIDIKMKAEALRFTMLSLHRMNLGRASLFPGFAGMAEALRNRVGLESLYKGVDGSVW